MSTRLLRQDRSGHHSFPVWTAAPPSIGPEAYAAALRLQDEGHDDKAIAVRLGLAPAAVGPLLRVAAAKLHNILAAGEKGT